MASLSANGPGILERMIANLAAVMECFLAVPPAGRIERRNGVSLFAAGPQRSVFNGAVVGAAPSWAAWEQAVCEAARFFQPDQLTWCLWACEELAPPYVRRRSERQMQELGLRLISQPPALCAAALLPPQRPPAELEIRRVATAPDAQAFCQILTTAFSGPAAQMRAVYGSEHLWATAFRGYIGRYRGLDVSITATLAAGGTIGLYTVGTLPQFCRRGFAEALIRHAVADTVQAYGLQPLVVQATADSLRLYRRLGFRKLGSFLLYAQP